MHSQDIPIMQILRLGSNSLHGFGSTTDPYGLPESRFNPIPDPYAMLFTVLKVHHCYNNVVLRCITSPTGRYGELQAKN
jgi:hypothetical protein